jgi:hypothetical protein
MKPRNVARYAVVSVLLLSPSVHAGWFDAVKEQAETVLQKSGGDSSSSSLTSSEIDGGLKEALRVGTKLAIEQLGREDGFFGNALVKIPVPEELTMVAGGLRKVGMGKYVDDFVLASNRAAEKAVPETAKIFADAITKMTLEDARNILGGPDDAATEYFRKNAAPALKEAILPIVKEYTEETEVTTYYKSMVAAYDSYAAPMVEQSGLGGLLGSLTGTTGETATYDVRDLDGYITGKSLDGLFTVLAQEEKKIRENPAARTTELLQKVFGK